jgi:hypothetical protein
VVYEYKNISLFEGNTYLLNSFQNPPVEKNLLGYPQQLLEENLAILGEIAYAEYNKDFKAISELTEKLHPHFHERLMEYISSVGFLSKEVILLVQTEVCLEILLQSVRKEDEKRISQLLDQLVWIHPKNTELYKFLWDICGRLNSEMWGEHAFHGRSGYFASVSDKEKAILEFKKLLHEEKVLRLSNSIPVSLEKEFEN